MKKRFRQKTVCEALSLPKQRIEYLMLKAGIKPDVPAQGTGTANQFDFGALLSFDIADCLSMWGFTFEKIKEALKTIRKSAPNFFEYDPQKDLFLPAIEHQVVFYRSGVSTKGQRGKDFQSFLATNQVLTLGEFQKSENLKQVFQKPFGTLLLNLSVRKTSVCVALNVMGE